MRVTLAVSVLLITAAGCTAGTTAVPSPTATPAPAVSPTPTPSALAKAGVNPDWMDATADPCNDFFAYACGGFVKTAEIPGDMATWGPTEKLTRENEEFLRDVLERASKDPGTDPVRKKIGDYYASCMDESAVEKAALAPLAPLFGSIAKVADFKTLVAAVTELHQSAVFPLFGIGQTQDFKDATKVIIAMDQAGLGLPDRDYYLKDEGANKDIRDFYKGHVERMLALTAPSTKWDAAEAKAGAEDVMRIETKIAKLHQDKVTRRDPIAVYHRVERAGLSKAAADIGWDDYLKALGLDGKNEITVHDTAYWPKLVALMKEEKPAAWQHYLAWQLMHDKGRFLTKAIVDENFAMRQKISGQKELPPRWKRCVRGVDESLGELLAQAWVAEKFTGDSKATAEATVKAIRASFKTNLAALPWMDDKTRVAAAEKLEKMNYKIGYPATWRAYDFEVVRGDYAKNAMAAESFEMKRQLAKVGKPVARDEWDMTPPTVNAYYNPSLNEMVLPAGILQPPFFSKDFLPAVNLGETGAGTVGHELTHGFDDEGSQFDAGGNLRDWWTPTTKKKFKEATKCVQAQYSAYDAIPGVKLNGELTSGENIADIGGVKLGYAAVVEAQKARGAAPAPVVDGKSEAQLFFLGYAQSWCSKETPQYLETMARTNPHSPAKWRVNGPVVDVPAFAQAFSCKAGAPMNPGKTCAVW